MFKEMDIRRDFMASLVVFMVALPLCMGIAISSGVPPVLGLVSGIIGGLVVGFIGGAPLQVSGPAAGLAVLVMQFVEKFGLPSLGWVVLGAGLIQIVCGALRLGRWFRAVSPAVVQGMLAGIGVLIFSSQFHVMIDDVPKGKGIVNLLTIPSSISKVFTQPDGSSHHLAAILGVLTIIVIVLWTKFKPAFLKFLPGPFVAVLVASIVAGVFGMGVSFISIPGKIFTNLEIIKTGDGSLFTDSSFWGAVIGFAVIASAETLLCATAVDRMHSGPRTQYDRELFAQGIGNSLCGLVGALPMTGVIVRSSANVESGAKSRVSAILHGLWLLLFVGFFPFILNSIPKSVLAAILVYTGYRLFSPVVKMWKELPRVDFYIYITTIGTIVYFDLLKGVLIGFGLALARLLYTFLNTEVVVNRSKDGSQTDVAIKGSATFIQIPRISDALEDIDDEQKVCFHLDSLIFVDHSIIEIVSDWSKSRKGEVVLDWDSFKARSGSRLTTPEVNFDK